MQSVFLALDGLPRLSADGGKILHTLHHDDVMYDTRYYALRMSGLHVDSMRQMCNDRRVLCGFAVLSPLEGLA